MCCEIEILHKIKVYEYMHIHIHTHTLTLIISNLTNNSTVRMVFDSLPESLHKE